MIEGKAPLVTVAVLSYRNVQYMRDCLNSILEQNYPELQLIISDDGSDDFDKNTLTEFIERNRRGNLKSVFLHAMPENGGTSRNFNFALRHAAGKYVKFIAADDLFYDADSLSHLVTVAENESSNVVIARAPNYDMYLEKYVWTYPSDEHWGQMKAAASNPKDFFGLMSQYCLISAPSVLFRRSFLNEMGGADEQYRFIEDWPIWMKMLRTGKEFTFLDEPVVIYRSGGVSNGEKNEAYAEHQIEYADVIRNECLTHPEAMATKKQYDLAQASERQHRFNGNRILAQKKSKYKLFLFAIANLGEYWRLILTKAVLAFWRVQEKKRIALLFGLLFLTICGVTDFSTLFDIFLCRETSVLLGDIFRCTGLIVGWGAIGFSILLYIFTLPVALWNTIKYSGKK